MTNKEIDLKNNSDSEAEIPLHHRTIKSFVRREGRMTEGQKRILAESPYCIDPEQEVPWDLNALFGRENTQRTLEIGFGNGDSLAEMAAASPLRDFLGVEVHRPGVGHLLLAVENKQLTNIRASDLDAMILIKEKLPKAGFDCLQIFFPDPWHKKRHNKRRLIQTEFLAQIYPILQVGGILHCATDWEPYAIHILEVLKASPLFENIYTDYAPRPEHRPLTKFERRGQRLGHGVWDIMFRKI